MMYDQRAKKSPERFEPRRPWRPPGLPAAPSWPHERAQTGPWYAAVDEIHDQWCRIAVDLWPDVDADGRLVFDIKGTGIYWAETEAAEKVILQARQASADSARAADRPLRVGDVFAIWPTGAMRLGFDLPEKGDEPSGSDADTPPASSREPIGGLVDITAEARAATQAAANVVGGGELTDRDLVTLGIPLPSAEK